MSNFKEIYPNTDFIEDLHRMNSIGTDDYMRWAYEGKVDEAPLTSDYVYQLVKNTKQTSGSSIIITDGIEMPLESFKLYGDTKQSGTPSMKNKATFDSIGTYNSSSGKWIIKCKNDIGANLLKNSANIQSEVTNGGSKTSAAFTIDSSFTPTNFAGKKVTLSLECMSENVIPNESSDRHRYGSEFSFIKSNGSTQYSGVWVGAEDGKSKDGRISTTFTIPTDWDGTVNERNMYIQRLGVGSYVRLWNLKLEEGDKASPWIPHKDDKEYKDNTQTISTNQPLSKLQNGVYDYYKDGYLYYNTVYERLDSKSNWQIDNIYSNDKITVISLFLPKAVQESINIWCTHFKPSAILNAPSQIQIKNQRVYITADAKTYPDLDSFIQWLDGNQVMVCYQRKNTIKEPMEPYVLLYSYGEYTKITNDQNALMEVEYRIAPNARLWQRQEDGSFKELV